MKAVPGVVRLQHTARTYPSIQAWQLKTVPGVVRLTLCLIIWHAVMVLTDGVMVLEAGTETT